jgi:hypothetical protein
MGRLSTIVLAVLVALTLASGALAGRGDPKRAIAKADQARAGAMLLRRSDLASGFRATPPGKAPNFYCAATDESDLTLTGDAESPEFTLAAPGRLFFISSQAHLYRTSADASSSWRRGTSPAGESCARKLLQQVLAGSGAVFESFGRESFPKVAPLTVAYRITAEIVAGANAVPTYIDVIVLQRGRAQVSLLILSAGAPLVRSETLTFARTTAARMAKAMAGAG